MTTNEDNDSGWDSLADELGVEPTASAPKPAAPSSAPPPPRPARDPRPEIEGEADDFGAGIDDERSPGAMYDPGPEAVVDDSEDFDDSAPEPMDDDLLGDEPVPSDSESEPSEGGKRRRRRRRRRKKGGQGAPDAAETPADAEAIDDDTVEEGEAPAEVEDDEDETITPSAMEEELEEEVVRPRQEWHVMTWLELVSKLHRPG